MSIPVVLIPGDGIGPEVTAAARAVVRAAGANLTWVEAEAGMVAAERHGDPLPAATLELIRRHRVALKGPCTTPVGKGFRSINVRMRQGLDLYASVRRDTENALRVVRPGGVVLWHDYNVFSVLGVTRWLNELRMERPLVWLAGTTLACLRLPSAPG